MVYFPTTNWLIGFMTSPFFVFSFLIKEIDTNLAVDVGYVDSRNWS